MPPALQLAAAATSALGVALGVRLLVVLSRSSALKPLAAATSAAAAALRTPRALATASSSPVAALLAASKAATKSYKAARTLDPASRLPSLPSSKHLKAAFAAASLVRLLLTAAPVPAASPAGVAVLALLKSGYKLSKNTSKVIEGFLGLQVHKGFRNGVDALGVVVKVAVIVSEVAVWVLGGRCWGGGRARCVRFLSFTRPPSLVLLGCSKSVPQVVLLSDPAGIVEFDDEGYRLEEPRATESELLSLAVPVPPPGDSIRELGPNCCLYQSM